MPALRGPEELCDPGEEDGPPAGRQGPLGSFQLSRLSPPPYFPEGMFPQLKAWWKTPHLTSHPEDIPAPSFSLDPIQLSNRGSVYRSY